MYLTPAEAAAQLRVSPKTLASWRMQHIGPVYSKMGGRIRYVITDLEDYVNGARCQIPPIATQKSLADDLDDTFLKFIAGLSRRAQTAIRNYPIKSFAELRALRSEDLIRIPNCGYGTINEIFTAAASCDPTEAKRSKEPLDAELERLVKVYGLKRVLSSIGNLV